MLIPSKVFRNISFSMILIFRFSLHSQKPSSSGQQIPCVECPLCFRSFSRNAIEEHASNCKVSIMQGDFVEVESGDETIEYVGDAIDNNKENSDSNEENFEEDLQALITAQKASEVQLLRIIRRKCWDMYIDKCKKKWFKRNSSISISFTGENGVGDGPRREFFEGDVCY